MEPSQKKPEVVVKPPKKLRTLEPAETKQVVGGDWEAPVV